MLSSQDVLALAEAYARATGLALTTVSGRALGLANQKAFTRLATGRGVNALTLERAACWLMTNWPADTPWPAAVPGGPTETVPRKAPEHAADTQAATGQRDN